MKKEIAAASMVGVLTFTGVGSTFAASPETDSVTSGNKSIVSKDENPDRHNDALRNLGIDTSLFASSEIKEQVKTTDKKIVLQINNPSYFVSNVGDSVEAGVWKKNDTAPVIINNRTMVPLRLIGETLGANVNWNSETNSITVKKDNKEINVQIGSNLMSINDQKSTKEITLDSPPIVDQNNRTLVPVRAISEAFGKSVIWDQATNSIFINYTEQEKADFIKNPDYTGVGGNVNACEIASNFIAGNEFMSDEEKNKFNAHIDTASGSAIVCTDGSDETIVKKITGLTSADCVYITQGEAYVFNDENLKQGNKTLTKYDAYGNPSTITNDKAGRFYFSRLTFDKNLGVCVFDGTKITHKLNTQTKQFDELPAPEFVGTLKQRTIYNLEAAYNARWSNDKGTNPLDLNYQDILEYKNTGSDANCKSFKLVKVSDNLGFICLTGGQCGLQEEKTFDNLKIAVQKCNNIDPIITKKWVERGLNFLAINEMSEPVFIGASKTWWGTFTIRDYGGVIWLNEKVNRFVPSSYVIFHALEEESNGLKYDAHIVNAWNAVIDGVSYTDIENYKKGEFIKTADKNLPPNWREVGFGD